MGQKNKRKQQSADTAAPGGCPGPRHCAAAIARKEHARGVLRKLTKSYLLEGCEKEYRGGNRGILIRVLTLCARLKLEIPAWVVEQLVRAQRERPKSWDDLFGPPAPKGKAFMPITGAGKIL